MRRWPAIGVALAVVWLFVRGVPLTPGRLAEEFLIGLAVSVPLAYAFRQFYADEVALAGTARAIPAAVAYLLVFGKELVVANLDVVYRVLAPSLPIEPDVVAVPLRVESDAAITTIANSITLTPGTLTMDYSAEANTLYVHGITGRNRQSLVSPIRTWEDYALVIFDEERSPDDPPPAPRGDVDGD
jgi:multicomponent Na+:H+ antiporter subunit E